MSAINSKAAKGKQIRQYLRRKRQENKTESSREASRIAWFVSLIETKECRIEADSLIQLACYEASYVLGPYFVRALLYRDIIADFYMFRTGYSPKKGAYFMKDLLDSLHSPMLGSPMAFSSFKVPNFLTAASSSSSGSNFSCCPLRLA